MKILYPRPYRKTRLQISWRTWRDLHPRPMAGYDMLKVAPLPWWQRVLYVRHGVISLNVGFGALLLWWRTR